MTPHVVIFPLMAEGHTLPLLDLSKALSGKQIKVTIITTPSNSKTILPKIENSYTNIRLIELPFPTNIDGLPKDCENTSQLPTFDLFIPFVQATKHLQKPFERVLQTMKESETLPLCVISDGFMNWTLSVCQAFSVPRLVFHGMGALSMAISEAAFVNAQNLQPKKMSDPLDLPGLNLPFVLTKEDLPEGCINATEFFKSYIEFMWELRESDINSWGVLINSFVELEGGDHISSLEAFYKDRAGAKAWCVGPLFLYNNEPNKPNPSSLTTKWLNDQAMVPSSVIYVSFGTQADVSDAQLDEVGFGLEESGYPFVWVVRSKTWSPPEGLEERIKGKGLIVREWVDQREILSHKAVGGFLSHYGWNSVLESVSAGVPILAWPLIAEQGLNARIVVDGFGAGVGVIRSRVINELGISEIGVVSRREICEAVKELMEGADKGRKARERAEALRHAAKEAVSEGGSSYRALDELIDQLRGRVVA